MTPITDVETITADGKKYFCAPHNNCHNDEYETRCAGHKRSALCTQLMYALESQHNRTCGEPNTIFIPIHDVDMLVRALAKRLAE